MRKPDFTLGQRGGAWYVFANNKDARHAQAANRVPYHGPSIAGLRVLIIRAGMSFETEE